MCSVGCILFTHIHRRRSKTHTLARYSWSEKRKKKKRRRRKNLQVKAKHFYITIKIAVINIHDLAEHPYFLAYPSSSSFEASSGKILKRSPTRP